jgi:hypothetical protein
VFQENLSNPVVAQGSEAAAGRCGNRDILQVEPRLRRQVTTGACGVDSSKAHLVQKSLNSQK